MNEKLQYAEMLDIPVSTCNITYRQPKKKILRRKTKVVQDSAKDTLIEKVNENLQNEQPTMDGQTDEMQLQNANGVMQAWEGQEAEQTASVSKMKKQSHKFKFSVVGVELVVIGLLIATIFITNTVYPQSGINTFFGNVFGTSNSVKQVDQRVYSDFDLALVPNGSASFNLNEGVISISGKASVYSPCDGKVFAIRKGDDGKFNITIKHSEKFSTVMTGLDLSYLSEGDSVYSNVPVGYVKDGGATLCFLDELGSTIVGYTLNDNQVVWAV